MRPFHLIALTGLVFAAATGCSDSSGPKGLGMFTLQQIDGNALPQAVPIDFIVVMHPTTGVDYQFPVFWTVGAQTFDATHASKWIRTSEPSMKWEPVTVQWGVPFQQYYIESRVDSGTYKRSGNDIILYFSGSSDSTVVTRSGSTLTWTDQSIGYTDHEFVWKAR